MHELQVMRQVVERVEEAGRGQSGNPSVVRLQISSQSHLAEHNIQDLEATFGMATHGTSVQGAKLEVVLLPVKGSCHNCGASLVWNISSVVCPACGSGNLVWENLPEVVVSEVEFLETS